LRRPLLPPTASPHLQHHDDDLHRTMFSCLDQFDLQTTGLKSTTIRLQPHLLMCVRTLASTISLPEHAPPPSFPPRLYTATSHLHPSPLSLSLQWTPVDDYRSRQFLDLSTAPIEGFSAQAVKRLTRMPRVLHHSSEHAATPS
jgi:hypothetical protein